MVDFSPSLPDTAHVGDSGHTDDHNVIVQALTDLNTALVAAEARLDALEAAPVPPLWYGPCMAMDGLANTPCGGGGGDVSFRFRAAKSDTTTAVRNYFETGGSYGSGTGGTIRISIEADDAGFPSGTPLAYTDVVHPGHNGGQLTTFSSPPSVLAGSLYHVVFTNIDGTPATNFVSVNAAWQSESVTPMQAQWPDADFAVCLKYPAESWQVRDMFTPIMDLTYGDGSHQGQGYMEVEIGNQPTIAGTTNMMRERFTVSGGNRQVTGAAVRMAKTGGTGDLTVRLEDSGGALIDSFTVAASSIPTLAVDANGAGEWVSGSFAATRTLTNGAEYRLRLSCPAGTTMWSRGVQKGAEYGYHPTTYFADGVLEKTTNGSAWSTVTGLEDNGDLQFYLTVE